MLDLRQYQVRFAQGEDEVRQAQRLRYEVFVDELGGDGPIVDHAARREIDSFDPYADHLILCDAARAVDDQVVGAYRLMTSQTAVAAGGFSSAAEYDLSPLTQSGQRLLELGRSCIRAEYRRGPALLLMWQALAAHVIDTDIDVLFGVASFHGTDVQSLAQPLSYLHQTYLAPCTSRPVVNPASAQRMDLLPPDQIDRKTALARMPPLIKSYLRLGGRVGQGAYIDRAFNTVDVMMVVEMANVPAKELAFYTKTAR